MNLQHEFEEHREFLTNLAARKLSPRLRRRMDPEDLVQEAVLTLLKAKATYDPALGTPKAYLATVVARRTANIVHDHSLLCRSYKREDGNAAYDDEEEGGDPRFVSREWEPSLVAELNETVTLLKKEALADIEVVPDGQLTRRERAVVTLRGAGWGLQEIGDKIGLSRERVRQIHKEALARLVGEGRKPQRRPHREKLIPHGFI